MCKESIFRELSNSDDYTKVVDKEFRQTTTLFLLHNLDVNFLEIGNFGDTELQPIYPPDLHVSLAHDWGFCLKSGPVVPTVFVSHWLPCDIIHLELFLIDLFRFFL